MSHRIPTRVDAPAERSLWLRLMALLVLVVVTTASTVQVCHAHGEFTLTRASSVAAASHSGGPAPAPGDRPSTPEDHCPLCVAMHSAMPVTPHVTLGQLVPFAHVTATAAEAERLFRWRFELLSRPPPAQA